MLVRSAIEFLPVLRRAQLRDPLRRLPIGHARIGQSGEREDRRIILRAHIVVGRIAEHRAERLRVGSGRGAALSGAEDPEQPGLPGTQRLALRAGHPAGGRPRRPGGLPDQHHPRLHRRPAGTAPGAAEPHLQPRSARRVRRAAGGGHLVGARLRARGAAAAAGRRARHAPGQEKGRT